MNRWAEIEFGDAKLGDPRRTRRLIEIATARAQRPSASLPQSFEDKAGLKGMYEFCDNEQVRRETILASHYQAPEERMGKERIVLAVQDTTEVDFTHHPATQGLGILHDEAHQGFLLHTTLAVTPSRLALGLIDQQILYRDAEDFGKKHRRRQRPIEEKESRKWLEGLRATAQIQARCPQSRLVSVGDREADVYDLFVLSGELKQDVLVRAAWNRRVDHEESYLWDHLEDQPLVGTLEITVPRRGHAPARTATCAVRSAQIRLKPPRHRAKEHLPVIPVHGVLVQEETPPPDVEGIEWLLLSTVPVLSFEDACERVQWYTCRWVIAVSSQGHINQSVKVRPRLKDSGLVAWEAPWRESKTVEPSDNVLEIEYRQSTRLQRAVNAEVASLHATPVAETVDNVRRQQGLGEMSPMRHPSPAGYQRRHGTKEEGSTGEARGARRGGAADNREWEVAA